jgi:hypothetical protein
MTQTPETRPEQEAAPQIRKPLTPQAQRALDEAQARREERERAAALAAATAPIEINGRGGLDPVRYGDWESKGITSDF